MAALGTLGWLGVWRERGWGFWISSTTGAALRCYPPAWDALNLLEYEKASGLGAKTPPAGRQGCVKI